MLRLTRIYVLVDGTRKYARNGVLCLSVARRRKCMCSGSLGIPC